MIETQMVHKDPLDPFTHHLIENLDPKVRDSLTPNQLSAIIDAARASRPETKHLVDLRGVIPLFYSRYYFVFLMGRDRRSAARRTEKQRRRWTSLWAWTLFLVVASLPVLLVIFTLLYFLKSSLGIDLLPDQHLTDIIGRR